eukprot:UN07735
MIMVVIILLYNRNERKKIRQSEIFRKQNQRVSSLSPDPDEGMPRQLQMKFVPTVSSIESIHTKYTISQNKKQSMSPPVMVAPQASPPVEFAMENIDAKVVGEINITFDSNVNYDTDGNDDLWTEQPDVLCENETGKTREGEEDEINEDDIVTKCVSATNKGKNDNSENNILDEEFVINTI